MCGEFFYIMPGEEIAIFSAEHDKFMILKYDDVKEFDMRETKGDIAGSQNLVPDGLGVDRAPILIFRPFQTVSALPIFFPYVHTCTSLTHSLVNNFLYNSVDNGIMYSLESWIGARQHVP